MQKQTIACIINPKSGVRQNKNLQDEILSTLDTDRYHIEFFETKRRGHATELAEKIVSEGYDILLVCGGDGTINEAVQPIVNKDILLGIIPTGSGNGLSMHTGIGREHTEAINIINRQKTQKIDCIRYGDKFLINLAGIGFDGFLTKIIARKTYRGFWLYIWLFIRYFWTYKPSTYYIETNTESIKGRYNMIEIANGPMYGYNFEVVPGADIADGIIDILLLKKTPIWRILLDSVKLMKNKWEQISWAKRIQCTSVSIQSDAPLKMHVDGEYVDQNVTSIAFQILPKSINFIIP